MIDLTFECECGRCVRTQEADILRCALQATLSGFSLAQGDTLTGLAHTIASRAAKGENPRATCPACRKRRIVQSISDEVAQAVRSLLSNVDLGG